MERLKMLRIKNNLSVTEMAERLQVSQWMYYKIESGARRPNYDFMARTKKEFNCSVDEIFF